MQKTMVGKIRRLGLAAALVALVAGTGVANAVVIKATWDPEYGALLPGLAFTGEAQFYVPDGCLAGGAILSPTFIADGAACSAGDPNGGISLRSAFVDLYTFDVNFAYSLGNRTFQERLTYAIPVGLYGSSVLPDPLLGIVVQYNFNTNQNEVIGAIADPIGPEAPADPDITSITAGLDGFFMLLGPDAPAPDDGTVLESAVSYQKSSLFGCVDIVGSQSTVCATGPSLQSNEADVQFSRVPEPGSLALVLGALAAGWAARRSRRPVEPAAC